MGGDVGGRSPGSELRGGTDSHFQLVRFICELK